MTQVALSEPAQAQQAALGASEPVCGPGGEHCPHQTDFALATQSAPAYMTLSMAQPWVGWPNIAHAGMVLKGCSSQGRSPCKPVGAMPSELTGKTTLPPPGLLALSESLSTEGGLFTNCLTRPVIPTTHHTWGDFQSTSAWALPKRFYLIGPQGAGISFS